MAQAADVEQRVEDLERFQVDIERRFNEAFPAGDHIGHRRYHELMIEDISERKKLRQAVVEKTVAGLVWGAFVAVGIAVWQYLKSSIKLP